MYNKAFAGNQIDRKWWKKYHSEKEIKKNKGIKRFCQRNGNAYGVCEGLIVQDM